MPPANLSSVVEARASVAPIVSERMSENAPIPLELMSEVARLPDEFPATFDPTSWPTLSFSSGENFEPQGPLASADQNKLSDIEGDERLDLGPSTSTDSMNFHHKSK